jgi:hypothetical protein
MRQVEDAERERDRCDRRPEQGDELACKEQPELTLRQCAEAAQTRMQAAR